MTGYTHAVVLIHGKEDGVPLLKHALVLAHEWHIKVTVAHLSDDYRELNFVSDSMMDDPVSQEVIRAKAMFSEIFSELDNTDSVDMDTCELVTLGIKDLRACISRQVADLVIAGHHNRFLGLLTSHSMAYINQLNVDVLIRHL